MRALRNGPILFLLVTTATHAAATVSLKAVAKNGIPIVPTNNLTVAPGDIITAEIYISGWNNPPFDAPVNSGLLQAYQITLDGVESVQSGTCDLLVPLGWDAPIQKDECPCSDPRFPICSAEHGCVGPNHHPEQMASINNGPPGRNDFIFYPRDSVCGVDVSSLNIIWNCDLTDFVGQGAARCQGGQYGGQQCSTNAQCTGGICNSSFQHYAGTLNLKVGFDACGVFRFNLVANPNQSFLDNGSTVPISMLPGLEPLFLTSNQICPVGACCNEISVVCTDNVCPGDCEKHGDRFGGAGSTCATMSPPCSFCDVFGFTSDPAHCTVDARIPYSPGNSSLRYGYESITLNFGGICSAEDSPADYQVTQIPATTPPLPPSITSIDIAGGTATLHFSTPIHSNRWTCVRHIASNKRVCLGFLPGDANSNRTANPSDVLAIIDNLNGVLSPPLQVHQCDIDRSGGCAPADILAEIDLLNGASGYSIQNSRTLEACPNTTP